MSIFMNSSRTMVFEDAAFTLQEYPPGAGELTHGARRLGAGK